MRACLHTTIRGIDWGLRISRASVVFANQIEALVAKSARDFPDGLVIVLAETEHEKGLITDAEELHYVSEAMKKRGGQNRTLPGLHRIVDGAERGGLHSQLSCLFIPIAELSNLLRNLRNGQHLLQGVKFNDAKTKTEWYEQLQGLDVVSLSLAIEKEFGISVPEEESIPPSIVLETQASSGVASLLSKLPPNFLGAAHSASEVMSGLRQEIRARLQPLVNQYLESQPHQSFEEKKALSASVNEHLQRLGLAIKCPKTGYPAILTADRRDAEGKYSRFRLDARRPEGGRVRTLNTTRLPDLELMEDMERIEPMSSWVDRTRQSRGKKSQRE